ncbi:unnamed protein product [Brachionus calyciflorus]|uniref:Vitelline membrane outer layer 1-like protein n=1 Tax=Brachionus calyciflorus TaxID=104777 RepID=A0A814LN75_9BILA|nr:unnamed protein product [Brachionus calyciflorus]
MKYSIFVILISILIVSSQLLLIKSSDYFIKNSNYEFTNDPRVILKSYSTTRIKCLLECLWKLQCFFITFKNETCQIFNKYALVKKILANNSFFYSKRSNVYSVDENLNDFFTTTSTATITTLPLIIISSVNNPYGVNWGIWGSIEECDQNDYVVGFRTKLHPFQGIGLGPSIDDTSLNGVELICSNGKTIKSSDGPLGSWDAQFRNCSNRQKIIGFSYGIHQNQGINDDTATNVIRLLCNDGSNIVSLEERWSTSIISISCPNGASIIGLRTQVDLDPNSADKTGLNNIEFICK